MPTCLSALSCYLVIGWLEIYVNEQLNRYKMAGERILWGFIFTKPAGKLRKIIFLHESPPVFPKNNFRVLAQICVKSRTSAFLIADSVQSLELIPAAIEQNSGYTLVMSPVRRPIHPHTPIQTWVKGFKLTNSSKEKEEARHLFAVQLVELFKLIVSKLETIIDQLTRGRVEEAR